MKSHSIIILIFLFCISCSQKLPEKEKMYIDLKDDPAGGTPVKLSSIASGIEYIPLESKRNTMLAPGKRIFVLDSLIVSCGFHQTYSFDRTSGKFVREIGTYGRGPGSYSGSSVLAYLNESRGIIINAEGWDYSLIEYSPEGKIQNQLKLKRMTSYATWLSGSLYAAFYPNSEGNDNVRMIIFNSDNDSIVAEFQNKRTCTNNTSRFVVLPYEAWFYYFENGLFFKEYLNDTIFQVTEHELVPRIIFDTGKHSPPYEERETFNPVDFYRIDMIIENRDYIFFRLIFQKHSYYGMFDKNKKTKSVSSISGQQISGFENDIDGFIQFQPQSISDNNELIGFAEAYEILDWFDKNPERAAKLPADLQKFRNLKVTDNPVIMIAKLKGTGDIR